MLPRLRLPPLSCVPGQDLSRVPGHKHAFSTDCISLNLFHRRLNYLSTHAEGQQASFGGPANLTTELQHLANALEPFTTINV